MLHTRRVGISVDKLCSPCARLKANNGAALSRRRAAVRTVTDYRARCGQFFYIFSSFIFTQRRLRSLLIHSRPRLCCSHIFNEYIRFKSVPRRCRSRIIRVMPLPLQLLQKSTTSKVSRYNLRLKSEREIIRNMHVSHSCST